MGRGGEQAKTAADARRARRSSARASSVSMSSRLACFNSAKAVQTFSSAMTRGENEPSRRNPLPIQSGQFLRLKMFRDDHGSWMTMFFSTILFLFIFSHIYNLCLLMAGNMRL
ncbi:hypothetical protein NDU88_004535 [Pleurodeles waltl]|uniref:Uncharacterized protein n=1 Tax=Pleurodeles waltl TaxID=8319 RepID=A0AAV7SJ76_PLEWA|nr:hypothetical protein NDU88_004535 [Pleurodeles waltl]